MSEWVGVPGEHTETIPKPFPPSTGPSTPRSNTCMRGPWFVFWKQCPDDPTTCGQEQVMQVCSTCPVFSLILLPSPPGLDCTLTNIEVFMGSCPLMPWSKHTFLSLSVTWGWEQK